MNQNVLGGPMSAAKIERMRVEILYMHDRMIKESDPDIRHACQNAIDSYRSQVIHFDRTGSFLTNE